MSDPNPITYRMLKDAGLGVSLAGGIDLDSPVICSCTFDEGHKGDCNLVAAHTLRGRLSEREIEIRRAMHRWPKPMQDQFIFVFSQLDAERAAHASTKRAFAELVKINGEIHRALEVASE